MTETITKEYFEKTLNITLDERFERFRIEIIGAIKQDNAINLAKATEEGRQNIKGITEFWGDQMKGMKELMKTYTDIRKRAK